jgi:hypothetical protein
MKSKPENEVMSREEVLRLLSGQARQGKVSAMIALERALRAQAREESELDHAIDRILTKGEGRDSGT